jgi:hypothetical protein
MAYERMMSMSGSTCKKRPYTKCIDDFGVCISDLNGYTKLCVSCEDEISPRESDGYYECKACGFYGTVYSPDYMKG